MVMDEFAAAATVILSDVYPIIAIISKSIISSIHIIALIVSMEIKVIASKTPRKM